MINELDSVITPVIFKSSCSFIVGSVNLSPNNSWYTHFCVTIFCASSKHCLCSLSLYWISETQFSSCFLQSCCKPPKYHYLSSVTLRSVKGIFHLYMCHNEFWPFYPCMKTLSSYFSFLVLFSQPHFSLSGSYEQQKLDDTSTYHEYAAFP